jgi:ariadne-1
MSERASILPLFPGKLAEDVASLRRVRSRFSKATDQQLPKIISVLIPKLLSRLETYSEAIQRQDDMSDAEDNDAPMIDTAALAQIETAKQDIYGILSAALERIRGNPSMPTESLVAALLPFVGSVNSVVGTWSLAFLQISISRTTRESVGAHLLATLIQTLGKMDQSFRSAGPSKDDKEQSAKKSLESRWIRISWLIFDCIMIISGQRPLIDWGLEEFTPQSNIIEKCDSDESRLARDETNKILQSDGKEGCPSVQGMVSLFLDLIIFWPDQPANVVSPLSAAAVNRMNHRSKSLTSEELGMIHDIAPRMPQRQFGNRYPGLPLHFQRHVRTSIPAASWTEMTKLYLRYLKAACIKFAVSPTCQELFRGDTGVTALLLSLCAANYDSMHGRMAIQFLNLYRDVEKQPVPLSVATSVVILTLGEEMAREPIRKFKSRCHWGCWESLLGQLAKNEEVLRPPLPLDVASRAAQFLIDNPIEWSCGDGACIEFLLELCLKMCQQGDRDRKFLAIRIISGLYSDLPFQNDVSLGVLTAVMEVLQTVVDMGTSNLEEVRDTQRQGHLPLGVPAPFNHRNDLNRLLLSHRQLLNRKNMKRDDAMEARKEAYRLVPLLSAVAFEVQNDNPFQLPNLLLQCAVHEDSYLEHNVMKAIDAILSAFVQRMDEQGSSIIGSMQRSSMEHEATSLLPTLLEVVCSEDASIRGVGIEWIQKLLVKMDVEAALYLAAFLVNDEDIQISQMATKFVSSVKFPFHKVSRTCPSFEFQSMGEKEGIKKIQRKLIGRVNELSTALNMSFDASQKLLLHSGFVVSKAVDAFRRDQGLILGACGLQASRMDIIDVSVPSSVCRICYDDTMGSQLYSLHCGHGFCSSCWVHYLKEATTASKFGFLDTRCPQHECNVCLLRSDVQAISPELVPRWNELILRCFVERDPSNRCCPGPDCQTVVTFHALPDNGQMKVTCETCQTTFCFHCGETPHAPATCGDFAEWKKLKGSSRLWLKHHSKPCPGCDAPIEKNGGCNHVHCSLCQTDFCWICLALLNRHLEAHTCNRYDPVESAENDFERHALFTATRYEAHDHAEDFASEQLRSFHPEKLLEAFWFLDYEHAEIFRNGLETLIHARCFLKYSYVASLGLRHKPETLRSHESHHACLEMFTERLSQLLEMNLQRYYLEQGEKRLGNHFRRVAFYVASISSYQHRILQLRQPIGSSEDSTLH